MSREEARESWEKLLNPKTLKANLTKASVFICVFEMLKDLVITRLESFYSHEYRDGKPVLSDKYKARFSAPKVSPFEESLSWHVELDAITENEKAAILALKDYRNNLAHELGNYIADAKKEINDDYFVIAIGLMNKIEKWWIINVEIATDPDYDGAEIDESQVVGGSIVITHMLEKVYNGDDAGLERVYAEFQKMWKKD